MALLITTKYLNPTENRGSRIKVTGCGYTKTYSYDHAASKPHTAAMQQFLTFINEGAQKVGAMLADGSDWYKLVVDKDTSESVIAETHDGRGYCWMVE